MNTIEQHRKDSYSQQWGRLVSRGMHHKAKRGVMPGRAPLGYRNAVVHGEKVIIMDPETAPQLKRLFELIAANEMNVQKLAVEAEMLGLRSRNGQRFSQSKLKAVLQNSFYCGLLKFRGETFAGAHEALVTVTTFEKVQLALGAEVGMPSKARRDSKSNV